jgi:hypothetical protein
VSEWVLWDDPDGSREVIGFVPGGPVRFHGVVHGSWDETKVAALWAVEMVGVAR